MSTPATIRPASTADDDFIARCFRNMWLDIGTAPGNIVDDAEDRVRSFIADARARLSYRGFVAEVDGKEIGCAAAQRFAGLYPDVLDPGFRKYGYVWGVWVAAAHRNRGVGRQLTEACIEALRELDCTKVLLHAAPMGQRVYEALGFLPTNEMALVLDDQ